MQVVKHQELACENLTWFLWTWHTLYICDLGEPKQVLTADCKFEGLSTCTRMSPSGNYWMSPSGNYWREKLDHASNTEEVK